jgi:DNA processing protein
MKHPLLTAELIITLQQLEGIGSKTILSKIAEKIKSPILTLEELCSFWLTLDGKKFKAISSLDIKEANNKAQRIIVESEKEDIGIITYFDEIYPEILKQCKDEQGKLDPPLVLYYRGNLGALKLPSIAIIGTREPTPNGKRAAEFFAAEFAKRGFNVVSGLAIGCDSGGHRGALSVKGITTAFLANGLDWDSIYPKENLKLAQDIVNNGGLLLSEYPIGQSCGRYGLVARDRLQAGLSKATIVIQTGVMGGTMHAVNATRASGKPIFAVEYRNSTDTNHEKVQGNFMLIQDKGAVPLSSNKIEFAISVIETANLPETKSILSQPTLFD